MIKTMTLFCVVSILSFSISQAQDSGLSPKKVEENFELLDFQNNTGVEFSFINNESIASLKFSDETVSNFSVEGSNATEPVKSYNWEISLSTPLNDNSGQTQFATLDRLVGNTKAGVKFSLGRAYNVQSISFEQSDSKRPEVLEKALRNCAAKYLIESERTENCRYFENEQIFYWNEKIEDKKGVDPDDLGIDGPSDFVKKYNPEEFYIFKVSGDAFRVSGSANIGYDDYKYLLADDLSSMTEQEFSYSAGLAVTYSKLQSSLAVSGGVTFESAFNQADEMENCIDDDDGEEQCVMGRLGAPERSDEWLGYVEARKLFDLDLGDIQYIGIAPRLTYNPDKDVTGFNFPVYLVQKESGLSGGFQVGWRSDEDDIIAGLIIGSDFSLFK